MHYTSVQKYGSKIYVRNVKNGQRHLEEVHDFIPLIFVPTKPNSPVETYHTLDGHRVTPFAAGGLKETKEFIEMNRGVENFAIYGDIQPQYQYISQNYPETIEWNISDINICYIDIETTCEHGFPDIATANEEIIAIGMKFSTVKNKMIFGVGEYTKEVEGQTYIKCVDEEDLIRKFLNEWQFNCPDIVTGWNVKFFDIPYLVNRITRVVSQKAASRLSPWGSLLAQEVHVLGRVQATYTILGVAVLDYIDLYKKFTYVNQETYRLDHIASVELGVKKIDYSEYGNRLHLLYKHNYELFIDYNSRDVDLVIMLENKLKLIELAITMAYDAKVNFEDVFSQVRMWDVIIYNHLLKKKIVIPPKLEQEKSSIEGAFVKDPITGMHDWIVSFDLTSLYPMLIQQYNISPETLTETTQLLNIDKLVEGTPGYVDELKEQNVCIAANGHTFRKDRKGFLPELMEWMFAQRKQYKTLQIKAEKELEELKKNNGSKKEKTLKEFEIAKYKNLQMSKKIALNSAYGAMGNAFFRYFDSRLAEAVTKSGQLSIRWIERKLNEYFNKLLKTDRDYIIAVDTDSVYIDFAPVVKQFMKGKSKTEIIAMIDKICEEQITPYIDKSYQQLADYMNAFQNKMSMKREAIADRGIWTAKKRYMMHVYDQEGVRYTEPKLKMMGIEAIKSSTPAECRKMIKQAITIILTQTEDDLIEYVNECRAKFNTLKPEEIAFPRSVNGLQKYTDRNDIYKKRTPIHVRGSLLYNHHLRNMQLTNDYSLIVESEKIKFMYLRTPNPFHSDVIAFPSVLPDEFGLQPYIDFNLQFQKSFLDPLDLILNAINWSHERIGTLDSLFD